MQRKPNNIKLIIIYALVLILTVATAYVGMYYMKDRQYYIVSLLILFYIMIPFVLSFEKRKPKARELIIIAVMIGIAVCGRAIFFMLPQFKPMVAIVIISGVCLGGQAGFLIGAMTAFVSNFMFGQGPWTPWQMLALGLIGFLSGLLFQKGVIKPKKLNLCIFGAIVTFFIYGGLVDIWTILMYTPKPTIETAILIYGAGLAFNLIHTVATILFLFFLAKPMLEKMERVKTKYGLMESSRVEEKCTKQNDTNVELP